MKRKDSAASVYINIVEHGKGFHRHTDFESARKEAERISGIEPGKTVLTLAIAGISFKKPVDTGKNVS